MLKHAALFLLLAPMVVSCGKILGFDEKRSKGERRANHGELAREIELIQGGQFVTECDERFQELRFDIARALDNNKPQIKALLAETSTSAAYDTENIGELMIRVRKSPPELVDKWDEYQQGWGELERNWGSIKGTKIDSAWTWLNSYVRGMLVDDRNRTIDGGLYLYDRSSIAPLQQMKSELDECTANDQCQSPPFSAASLELISGHESFKYWYDRCESDTSNCSESKVKIRGWLEYHLSSLGFVRNDSIRYQDGRLIVPLNAGVLDPYRDQLAQHILPKWQYEGLKVEIEWTDDPAAFRFVLEDDVGGRAFVRYRDKTIHVSDGVRAATLAHEFGHVLGLPDEYYTTWQEDACAYRIQYNDANIMSNSYGSVNEDHVRTLLKAYAGD